MHSYRCSGAFSQAEIKVKQRSEPKGLPHQLMSRFFTLMGGDHVIQRLRAEGLGNQCASGGNKAVHQDWYLFEGGTQNHSGNPGDLEAADFGEDIDGVGFVGLMAVNRFPDHFDLINQSGVINPGASASDG